MDGSAIHELLKQWAIPLAVAGIAIAIVLLAAVVELMRRLAQIPKVLECIETAGGAASAQEIAADLGVHKGALDAETIERILRFFQKTGAVHAVAGREDERRYLITSAGRSKVDAIRMRRASQG